VKRVGEIAVVMFPVLCGFGDGAGNFGSGIWGGGVVGGGSCLGKSQMQVGGGKPEAVVEVDKVSGSFALLRMTFVVENLRPLRRSTDRRGPSLRFALFRMTRSWWKT
jgi:hypothetical protein